MKRTLIFLHVPKAGGNSLIEYLLPNFPEHERFDINEGLDYAARLNELAGLPIEQKASLRLVYGHLPFGVHGNLPNQCRYFTVLRHPIDRVASHYFFVREQPNHPLHGRVVSGNLSLAEYAVSGLSGELNDGMTRLLSGRPDSDSLRGHAPCQPDELERAIDHLERHFDVVGLLEQIDSTFKLLSAVYGWPSSRAAVRNRTKSRRAVESLSAAERDAILSKNQLDLHLYQWAQKAFSRKCGQHGIRLRRRGTFQGLWKKIGGTFS